MTAQHSLDSLKLRGKLAKFFAWSFIAVSGLQLCTAAYGTFKPNEIVVYGGEGDPFPLIWPIIFGVASALVFVVLFAVMICALLWIYKAHANLREHGTDLKYSPGWAVGSYFIPVINLLVPFQAMRELYNRSHGEIPEHAHSTVEDVSAWWMSYMVGLFILFGLVLKVAIDTFTNIVFLTPVWMEFTISAFSTISIMVALYMLTKLITSITLAQEESSYVGRTFE